MCTICSMVKPALRAGCTGKGYGGLHDVRVSWFPRFVFKTYF